MAKQPNSKKNISRANIESIKNIKKNIKWHKKRKILCKYEREQRFVNERVYKINRKNIINLLLPFVLSQFFSSLKHKLELKWRTFMCFFILATFLCCLCCFVHKYALAVQLSVGIKLELKVLSIFKLIYLSKLHYCCKNLTKGI